MAALSASPCSALRLCPLTVGYQGASQGSPSSPLLEKDGLTNSKMADEWPFGRHSSDTSFGDPSWETQRAGTRRPSAPNQHPRPNSLRGGEGKVQLLTSPVPGTNANRCSRGRSNSGRWSPRPRRIEAAGCSLIPVPPLQWPSSSCPPQLFSELGICMISQQGTPDSHPGPSTQQGAESLMSGRP